MRPLRGGNPTGLCCCLLSPPRGIRAAWLGAHISQSSAAGGDAVAPDTMEDADAVEDGKSPHPRGIAEDAGKGILHEASNMASLHVGTPPDVPESGPVSELATTLEGPLGGPTEGPPASPHNCIPEAEGNGDECFVEEKEGGGGSLQDSMRAGPSDIETACRQTFIFGNYKAGMDMTEEEKAKIAAKVFELSKNSPFFANEMRFVCTTR